MDGNVYATDRQSAVKVFNRSESYVTERDVYLRLDEHQVKFVAGLNVPQLIGCDDELETLEISVVQPPYVLDFAKATLDTPPTFPEEVMQERLETWAEQFEDRWPRVLQVLAELRIRYGIHLLDPSPRNIDFGDG